MKSMHVGLKMSASSPDALKRKFPSFQSGGREIQWSDPIETILLGFQPILQELTGLFGKVVYSTEDVDQTVQTNAANLDELDKDATLKPKIQTLYNFIHYIDLIRSLLLTHPDNYEQLYQDNKVEFISPKNPEALKNLLQFFELDGEMQDKEKSVESVILKFLTNKNASGNNNFTFAKYCATEVMFSTEKDVESVNIFTDNYLTKQIAVDDYQILELALLVLGITQNTATSKRSRDTSGQNPSNKRPKKEPKEKRKAEGEPETEPTEERKTKRARPDDEEKPEKIVIDLEDAPFIGSSLGDKLKAARFSEENKRKLVKFYRMYYFLSSLYYYCTDMWNILKLATHIQSRPKATFLELQLTTFVRVRVYYITHVVGYMLRYFDINSGKTKENRAVRTLLLTGNNDDASYTNYRNLIISIQDRRVLDQPSLSEFFTFGLHDHIWSNLSKTEQEPLFMPYLVWSMFTQVDINPNVASAYTTDDYEPNLVLRGNSLAFRSQVSLYLRQWLTILKLNSDKASDSLSMQDYNSALQTHIRAIPLVNKGVTLVKNETKETSERMRYFYQVLGSNERGGKSKAKPAKDEESELLANDGDIETFEGEGQAKPEAKNVLAVHDVVSWWMELFYNNKDNISTMGNMNLSEAHFLVLDARVLRQPKTQVEWMNVERSSFKRIMFMHMTETAILLYFRKSNKSSIQTLFAPKRGKQEDTYLILHASDLKTLPQTFMQKYNELILGNLTHLVIDRPLVLKEKEQSSPDISGTVKTGYVPTIYLSDDSKLGTIKFSNLTVVGEGPLRFKPIQRIHIRSSIKHTLVFDFSLAVFNLATYSTQEVDDAIRQFIEDCIINDSPSLLRFYPKYQDTSLEDSLASHMPASFQNNLLTDPIDSVSRYWWNAHLFNHNYDVKLEAPPDDTDAMDIDGDAETAPDDLIITDMEDLRQINVKEQLVARIPFLGPHLLDTPNYLNQFTNIKDDIKKGRHLLGFSQSETQFKLRWTPYPDHTDEDVQRLNDFKLYRTATHVLNWLTDSTSMLIYSLDNPTKLDKQSYVPTVITNGFSLLAYSYNKPKSELVNLEYLKGSHVSARNELDPLALTNDSILLTLRKPVFPQPNPQKDYNWMGKICSLNGPIVWSNLGPNVANVENFNKVGEYADTFFGFTGFALFFSHNNINMRKSILKQENEKSSVSPQDRENIVNAFKEGHKTITLKRLEPKKTKSGEIVKDDKGDPVLEEVEVKESVEVLMERLRTIDRTNNETTDCKPLRNHVMLLDFFDTDRMDTRGVRIYHELLPDEQGRPRNRHAIYYSDEILRSSDIVVPNLDSTKSVHPQATTPAIPVPQEHEKVNSQDKRILLMTVWVDEQTDFVVQVPLDTIFTLLALMTIQIPLSPLAVLQNFQTREHIRSNMTDTLYTPFIQFPDLGNIHSNDNVSTITLDSGEKVKLPLGHVPTAYRTFSPVLKRFENILAAHPQEADNLVFHRLYDVTNRADETLKRNLALQRNNGLSEADTLADIIYNEDAIWTSYAALDMDHHSKIWSSDFTMENLWRPQCNTDFLHSPMALLGPTFRKIKVDGEQQIVKVSNEEQIQLFLRQTLSKDTDHNDEEIMRRDLPFLSDTWAFPREYTGGEQVEYSATLPTNLSEAEKLDRHLANVNFGMVVEHFLRDAAVSMYDSTLYINLCAMAMMVLRKKFIHTQGTPKSIWHKVTDWFCDEFYPIYFAYQVPADLFESSMYRVYDEKENFVHRQKWQEEYTEKLEKSDKTNEAKDDVEEISETSEPARVVGIQINEHNAPIYLNETLLYEINQSKFFWLYDYAERSMDAKKFSDFLKKLGLSEEEDSDDSTEDKKKKHVPSMENVNKMRDQFLLQYSKGDCRSALKPWPWALEEENNLAALLKNETYKKQKQRGISEIKVTMTHASTSILEEIRLFKPISNDETAMRVNSSNGPIYFSRPYPYIPLSGKDDEKIPGLIDMNGSPFQLELIDEQLYLNLKSKHPLLQEPQIPNLSIIDVTSEDDMDIVPPEQEPIPPKRENEEPSSPKKEEPIVPPKKEEPLLPKSTEEPIKNGEELKSILYQYLQRLSQLGDKGVKAPDFIVRFFTQLLGLVDSVVSLKTTGLQSMAVLANDKEWVQNIQSLVRLEPTPNSLDESETDFLAECKKLNQMDPIHYRALVSNLNLGIPLLGYLVPLRFHLPLITTLSPLGAEQVQHLKRFFQDELAQMLIKIKLILSLIKAVLIKHQNILMDKGDDESFNQAEQLMGDQEKIIALDVHFQPLLNEFVLSLPLHAGAIENFIVSWQQNQQGPSKEEEEKRRLEQRRQELLKRQQALKK